MCVWEVDERKIIISLHLSKSHIICTSTYNVQCIIRHQLYIYFTTNSYQKHKNQTHSNKIFGIFFLFSFHFIYWLSRLRFYAKTLRTKYWLNINGFSIWFIIPFSHSILYMYYICRTVIAQECEHSIVYNVCVAVCVFLWNVCMDIYFICTYNAYISFFFLLFCTFDWY